MEPELVVPWRKQPPAMGWGWMKTPDPVVVALPVPLPKVRVKTPVLGRIEPLNEPVGEAGNLTKVSLWLMAILVKSRERPALEIHNWGKLSDHVCALLCSRRSNPAAQNIGLANAKTRTNTV